MFSNFLDYYSHSVPEIQAALSQPYTAEDVRRVLYGEPPFSLRDVAAITSVAAQDYIQEMAVRAKEITSMRFGRTIQLYIPLYLSNLCVNSCKYCGFSKRHKGDCLTFDQVKNEAQAIYDKGFRHILLVAGEDVRPEFRTLLLETVRYLRPRFSSISIEIAPQSYEEYQELVQAGVDSLTVYQETYDPETYKEMHPRGPKADYVKRMKTPDYGAKAGIRRVNLGALLGLYHWQFEFCSLVLHYEYMSKKYWQSSYSLSFPRMREFGEQFKSPYIITDLEFVQMIFAARILMPDIGLVMSTRESAEMRDNMVGMGITQMSAESSTQPGGYVEESSAKKQFEISDQRSALEVVDMIKSKGYDPVWKDWEEVYYG